MTITAQSKSALATATPMVKAGAGWDYDDPSVLYDDDFDDHGRRVLYDSVGTQAVATGISKSALATATPLTKNNA